MVQNDNTSEIKKAIESILLTKNKYYSPTALNIVLDVGIILQQIR